MTTATTHTRRRPKNMLVALSDDEMRDSSRGEHADGSLHFYIFSSFIHKNHFLCIHFCCLNLLQLQSLRSFHTLFELLILNLILILIIFLFLFLFSNSSFSTRSSLPSFVTIGAAISIGFRSARFNSLCTSSFAFFVRLVLSHFPCPFQLRLVFVTFYFLITKFT